MKSYNIDFENRLKTVVWMLRILGLWSNFPNVLYSLYTCTVLAVLNLHNFFQLAYLVLVSNEFETIVISAVVVFEEIIYNVKAYGVLMYQSDVKKFIEASHMPSYQPKNATQKKMAIGVMQKFKFFHVLFTVSSAISITLMAFYGLFNEPVHPPMPAWYPFNQTRYFTLTFAHQAVAMYYIGFTHINIDCFSIGVMAMVIAQCDMLADSIKHLLKYTRENLGTVDENSSENLMEIYENQLVEMIKHHKEILKHFKGVYNMLNWIILAQYVSSTGTLCMTLLQATLIEPSNSIFITMLLYESVMVAQLFLYCWWGNEVMTKSEELPKAAFESDWLKTSPRFKKDLMFFLHKTQTPLAVYGADYFQVSLQSFVMVLRHSYSFYAVISRMKR